MDITTRSYGEHGWSGTFYIVQGLPISKEVVVCHMRRNGDSKDLSGISIYSDTGNLSREIMPYKTQRMKPTVSFCPYWLPQRPNLFFGYGGEGGCCEGTLIFQIADDQFQTLDSFYCDYQNCERVLIDELQYGDVYFMAMSYDVPLAVYDSDVRSLDKLKSNPLPMSTSTTAALWLIQKDGTPKLVSEITRNCHQTADAEIKCDNVNPIFKLYPARNHDHSNTDSGIIASVKLKDKMILFPFNYAGLIVIPLNQ